MKYVFLPLIVLVSLLSACGSDSSGEKQNAAGIRAATPELAARAVVDAMAALSQKSGAALDAFTRMFDANGVRFCPYYRTESTDRIMTAQQFAEEFAMASPPAFQWGTHDGSGEPIEMNLHEYWQRYVWDQPYHTLATPHEVNSADDFQGKGNMVNNLLETYAAPEFSVVEYHQPGQDPELDGMDWTSLILVLRAQADNTWTLVAIAHGSWTI